MFEGKLARLAVKEARLWSNFLKVENSRNSGLSPCLIDKLVIIHGFVSFILNREGKNGNVGSVYRLHAASVHLEQPVRGRV